MSGKKRTTLFILGVASVLGISWLIRKRREEVSGLHVWRQVLTRRHGAEKAGQLTEAIRQQYAALVAEATMPENRALHWHLKDNILPGLALYRVLLQEHAGNQQAALDDVNEAFRLHTLAKSRPLFAPLKLLPDAFPLFKLGFYLPRKQR